jgi:hypothetical protein
MDSIAEIIISKARPFLSLPRREKLLLTVEKKGTPLLKRFVCVLLLTLIA